MLNRRKVFFFKRTAVLTHEKRETMVSKNCLNIELLKNSIAFVY